MNLKNSAFAITGLGIMMSSSLAYSANTMPSQEDMWEIIQQQQKQIEALLKNQQNLVVKQQNTQEQIVQVDKKVIKADEKIEQTIKISEETSEKVEDFASIAPAAGGNGWWNKTQLGGYAELHYNGLKDSGDDEIDLHRFVFFASHDFTDDIRFFSELEIEHSLAGEGKNGEVELEQAYVEFDLSDTQQAKAGMFLIPVGILNETHEPNTFFGVERNPVEKNIIPTTWWEAGVGLNGQISNGFSYDVALHSGLKTPTSGSDSFKVRSGRQKVSEADADKGAVTGRLKWTGMPGVELATTAQYQQDVAQADFNETVSATLLQTHADIRKGPWGLRALYARWDLDGNAPKILGRDEQVGWFIEPSYRFDTELGEWGVFARYNAYDNEAGSSADTEYVQYDVGVNYWPHKNVVLKADMQFNDDPANGEDDEILNLGVGLQF